jgi:hypothetical protein
LSWKNKLIASGRDKIIHWRKKRLLGKLEKKTVILIDKTVRIISSKKNNCFLW